MNDLQHFNFDGLDESALGYHPEHGPIVHKSKFYAWIGYGTTNNTRTSDRHHMGEKDLVKGIFIPIGGSGRGRKADALTVRGVRRILLRSDHPRALEYADKVLDILDELATRGAVIDEKRITDEQAEAVKERIEALQQRRLTERMDYKHVQRALKLGGAISEDYRIVQNTLYIELFGMTASAIRATQEQLTGERKKDGTFSAASKTIAKNYLTEDQLTLLNNTVLAMFVQINQHYPNGASVKEMLAAVRRAVELTRSKAVTA